MDTYTAVPQDKIILHHMPTAYFLFDDSYKAVDCNRAAVNLFAPPTAGKIHTFPCNLSCDSCTLTDDISPCPGRLYLTGHALSIYPGYENDKTYIEKVVANSCARALAEGRLKFEHTFSTLFGDMIPCEITIVPLSFHAGQGYVYYFRDLHDSQLIRAEMKSREAAEEESRAKSRFLARMSHEIRTPMNAVLGITEVELQKDGLPAETKEALMRIHSSSSLLLTIINDILDLSKVEAGKMEIVANPYEIASLLIDTVRLNLIHSIDKSIDFNLSVDEKLPMRFSGDEPRIKQVLNNILSNAFKYTQKGSVSLAVSMEETHEGPVLIFRVSDTGQGMNREQTESLFSEFSRFNANRNIEGSGLGMSITHQLVSLMGGEILVESEPGAGSIFTVRIPQTSDSDEIIGKELAESLQSMETSRYNGREKMLYASLPYGKVLIVDDMESNLYVAKRLMEPYGLNIDEAINGYDALGKLKYGEVYDIIFMDHLMPGIDGIETVKQMRGLGYENPIVALTASTLGKNNVLFEKYGFDGFISKPIDIRQLDSYIMKFIGNKTEGNERTDTTRAEYSPMPIGSRMAEAVARDIGVALEALDISYESFDNSGIQQYMTYTHAMKNALNIISETRAAQMAALLEQAAHDGSLSDIRTLSPGFVSRLKEIHAMLTLPDDDFIADESQESTALLKSRMEALKHACDNFNITHSWQIMDELEQKPWSKETKALLSKISGYLIGGYYDEVAETAQKIAEGADI